MRVESIKRNTVFALIKTIIFMNVFLINRMAFGENFINIDYDGLPRKVLYDLYVPPSDNQNPLPVLVCVGGLPVINDEYIHSSTQECMDDSWREFARDHHMAILGLGFLFDPEQWPLKTSYQYPQAWSGQALLEILDILKQQYLISPDQLYLFGVSAGAQFSLRFALMAPERVKAVAAHAFGGYDLPTEYIPVKFLVTVGENDNSPISRREFLELFFRGCREKGIDIRKKIIPGIGHWQTDGQNQMSREFFSGILPPQTTFFQDHV